MAFSDKELQFLRERRISRNHIVWVIAFVLLAVGVISLSSRKISVQPVRQTAPIAARQAPPPAAVDATRVLDELRALQRDREASIQRLEKIVESAKAVQQASRPAPPPAAAAEPAPRPQRPQPASVVTPTREPKVLTRADMDAELARRAAQIARDKAEIDRLNAEKEAEKQKRIRIAEAQERKERWERLRRQRIWIHRRTRRYRLPEEGKMLTNKR